MVWQRSGWGDVHHHKFDTPSNVESHEHHFLLQRVQPAMIGLIDGSLSTLAPIFSVVLISHKPLYAFVAGLATSFGAGVSMAFSEGLSDTGELTGRGQPHDASADDCNWSCLRRRGHSSTLPSRANPRAPRSANKHSD